MDRLQLLKDVFLALNEKGIRYVVLRNYDFLLEQRDPAKHSERSIDLSVHSKDYLLFHQVMETAGFTKRKTPQFSRKHVSYFRIDDREIISFDVQVGGIHWNDICYLSDTFIFQRRIKRSFFYTLSSDDMFVMLLLHSILGKRRFKPEYLETLAALLPSINKDYLKKCLQQNFSRSVANKIFSFVISGNLKKIILYKLSIIASFIFRSPKRTFIFSRLFFRWLSWKKIGWSYPLISIIGPDGAGKSTLAAGLASFLRLQDRKVSIAYTGRGRKQLLPFRKLGNRYKSLEKKKDFSRKKKKTSVARKILYTVAAPVFTMDLLLRYFFLILPKRKRHHFVITDRYCSDIFLMDNVPLWFRSFLLHLFPKPSITFYLYNDVEILMKRRPKESPAGLQRQMVLFKELNKYLKPIAIKTENQKKDLENAATELWRFILHNWY
ncbi:hypothetical protein COV20_03780 [Candidatus Woesearchaeota archaeon CG10_big_fil_rev_8_21_14_0_10_45_16]|nr:MAG: hypothetical protein COV20_03780 [Candidatus Woesearchaeota archaeon CG10_big_fil_rev_8_21_14_0_10_45_16]